MKGLCNKLKKVKAKDVFGILIFIIVLIPALIKKIILKINKQELFLICEQENTAHDNGYIFFKYMKEVHPEVKCFYAINKKSKDYEKVKNFSNVIHWSSFRHYYYYLSSTKNISSHKEGNPNESLFTVLHIYLNLFNNRVFLQHGVLYQDFQMFYQKNTKFKMFVAGAKPECNYIIDKYGYKNGEVKYTGLARFDNLYNNEVDNKAILLIPTWRRWLDTKEKFSESCYYKTYLSLINSNKLIKILEKYDKYLYFYPHISTQKFIDMYHTNSDRIKILNANTVDIQELLKKGSLLITDYSSIFTDFAYMKKTILYYQFDVLEFHEKHFNNYKPSYFDFERDGFGKVVDNEEDLITSLENNIKNNFKMEKVYENRIDNFFPFHDNKNCERIFKAIMEVK